MESSLNSHEILLSAMPSGETVFSIFVLALFLWIVRPWSGTNSKGVSRGSVEKMILYMLSFMGVIFIVQRLLS